MPLEHLAYPVTALEGVYGRGYLGGLCAVLGSAGQEADFQHLCYLEENCILILFLRRCQVSLLYSSDFRSLFLNAAQLSFCMRRH